jgi:Zn/Cd-binding protein ZinT
MYNVFYMLSFVTIMWKKSKHFQLYHGDNKLLFDEMMTSTLYKTNMLSWTFNKY